MAKSLIETIYVESLKLIISVYLILSISKITAFNKTQFFYITSISHQFWPLKYDMIVVCKIWKYFEIEFRTSFAL